MMRPAVLLDHGKHDRVMLLETANRAGFICAHEGAKSSNIGREYCRQPAGSLGVCCADRRHLGGPV